MGTENLGISLTLYPTSLSLIKPSIFATSRTNNFKLVIEIPKGQKCVNVSRHRTGNGTKVILEKLEYWPERYDCSMKYMEQNLLVVERKLFFLLAGIELDWDDLLLCRFRLSIDSRRHGKLKRGEWNFKQSRFPWGKGRYGRIAYFAKEMASGIIDLDITAPILRKTSAQRGAVFGYLQTPDSKENLGKLELNDCVCCVVSKHLEMVMVSEGL
jgi:hypothetical protein